MEFFYLGHLDVAVDWNRYMASEPQFESKMPKYFQNLHFNLKTMNSERKFRVKKWSSGLFKIDSELVGQGLHDYQNSSLRIRCMISLCTFSVIVISPRIILGAHSPNET